MASPNPDLKSLFCEALERPGGPERDAYLDDACRGNLCAQGGSRGATGRPRPGRPLPRARPEGRRHADGSKTLAAGDAPSIATDAAETIANGTHESAGTSASETLALTENGSGTGERHNRRFAAQERATWVRPGPRHRVAVTLRNLLGEGGLGAVYLAEQSEPVKRQVALKWSRLGMDSPRSGPVRAERQALALMDHPDIARVYDGGTTEWPAVLRDGAGERPADHGLLRRERLPVRARLELFVASLPGGAARPSKGHHPPRPQAGQHAGHRRRRQAHPQGHRLRRGQGHRGRRLTEQSSRRPERSSARRPICRPSRPSVDVDIDTRHRRLRAGRHAVRVLTGTPPFGGDTVRSEILRIMRAADPPRPSTRLTR